MAHLGTTLLEYYVTEWLVCTYPRLPQAILDEAAWAYVSDEALNQVGRAWGIETAPTRAVRGALVEDVAEEQVLGRLQYGSVVEARDGALTQYKERSYVTTHAADGTVSGIKHAAERQSKAMAKAVRAIVAGMSIHESAAATRTFIYDHVLSRQVDIAAMFRFDQPTREVARLCAREGFEAPVSRLLAETGRHSRHPVYVVGVFSGTHKLGEGQGASLSEAKNRAAIAAMKAWYLFSPAAVSIPSAAATGAPYAPAFVDAGEIIV
ncbi:uncharacterized protein V1510DRAFT_422030 [Dipodascopsis tothii]|uniref:uncharacterized protein n=1 Tax=Dipodascopsis tothii TaxID=44089 RepID=UPI0034CD975F